MYGKKAFVQRVKTHRENVCTRKKKYRVTKDKIRKRINIVIEREEMKTAESINCVHHFVNEFLLPF